MNIRVWIFVAKISKACTKESWTTTCTTMKMNADFFSVCAISNHYMYNTFIILSDSSTDKVLMRDEQNEKEKKNDRCLRCVTSST